MIGPRLTTIVRWSVCSLLLLTAVARMGTPARAQPLSTTAALAPRLDGLGTLSMPVTTSVPEAQRFFDQGVRLVYAFNHQEALRAFQEAARLDPRLAMAHWGQAMALAPNLNAPLTRERSAGLRGDRRSARPHLMRARASAHRRHRHTIFRG
jgi:hypothetical protein